MASGESAASSFEKQAEHIEVKLVKTPADEDLLANLTRARINAANSMITNGEGESQDGTEEIKHQLALASESWSKYVDAASEPSAGLAIQVAPALFTLAQNSSTGEEALESVKAATEAEQIVAEKRNDLNSWSTLAFYALFTQNYKLAEEAKKEAIKLANDTEYGLCASIYTSNAKRAIRGARAIRAGTVTVNSFGEGDITTPFGGFKSSGFGGRDNGIHAHDQYTRIKTIWLDLTDDADEAVA